MFRNQIIQNLLVKFSPYRPFFLRGDFLNDVLAHLGEGFIFSNVFGEIVIQRWRHGTATGYPGRAANVTTLAQGFGRIRFAGDYMMPIDGVDASESGTAAARSILAALSVSP